MIEISCSRLLCKVFITCTAFKASTVDLHDDIISLLFTITISLRKNHLFINKNFVRFTFFSALLKIIFSASDLLFKLRLKTAWMSFLSEYLSVRSDYLICSITILNFRNQLNRTRYFQQLFSHNTQVISYRNEYWYRTYTVIKKSAFEIQSTFILIYLLLR